MDSKIPKVGDIIYLDGELNLSHGADDILGGKVTVSKIESDYDTIWIIFKQYPNAKYNWKFLGAKQKELKKEYNNQWSKPNPDLREEFNRWD
jgi:hypothetical protein